MAMPSFRRFPAMRYAVVELKRRFLDDFSPRGGFTSARIFHLRSASDVDAACRLRWLGAGADILLLGISALSSPRADIQFPSWRARFLRFTASNTITR